MREIRTNILEFKSNIHDYREHVNFDQLILDAIMDILGNEPTNLQYANKVLDSLPKKSLNRSH